MPIPDYQSIMLPLLKFCADGQEHSIKSASEHVANAFKLTEQEKKELLPSQTQTVIYSRTSWARTYLSKAGLLAAPKKAHLIITTEGVEVLGQNPEKIDNKFLTRFPQFAEFKKAQTKNLNNTRKKEDLLENPVTPNESLYNSYQEIRQQLSQEVLSTVKKSSPAFFERLVLDVLLKMGYGGSLADAGEAVGRTGDGGIDGIIKEDKLGLDVIYVQAKRWDGSVGSKEIRDFVGALEGKRANKGVFITTSAFTDESGEYVKTIGKKVVLIDGAKLVELMIDNDVGVSTVSSYFIKKIDSDYFEEE
ncbi:MAG: restriction endonuclease [Elusimicrobiales bacterium]